MIDENSRIDALVPKVAGNPRGMLHLAGRMKAQGQQSRAAAMCVDLLELPDVPLFVTVRAQEIIADSVANWHQPMVLDRARNRAYEAALARVVKPGMRVLEIGTGAGLLAMMAVRAGAAHVTTCEVDALLARVATEVVAANGMADRITVLHRHSSSLDAERDLGGRADLLLSEIIGRLLIDEGVLPSHADAVERLLVPGAPVMPLRGSIRVALAELNGARAEQLTDVEGFDLSAFLRLQPPNWSIGSGSRSIALRSEPHDLFRIAFDGSASLVGDAALACRSTGGRVNGALQWISFDVDEATTYDNGPGPSASSHWALSFHPLPQPRDTAAGEVVEVHGCYDRANMTIWAG